MTTMAAAAAAATAAKREETAKKMNKRGQPSERLETHNNGEGRVWHNKKRGRRGWTYFVLPEAQY